MFGWEFPPQNSGGLGTACKGLTQALLERKVSLVFVLPKKMGVTDSKLNIITPETGFFSPYFFDSPITPYITGRSYGNNLEKEPSIYGKNLFEEVYRYSLFGKEVAKREKFDIIHAHDWLSLGAGVEAKKISGKPLIAHIHATEFDRGGGEGIDRRVYNAEKEGMMIADKIITVSNFTKNIIITHYGIEKEKVEVVYNGVFPSHGIVSGAHKMKEAGRKMVLFVGRITLQKGPDYFVSAAQKVCRVCDNVFFVMAGSGDMEQSIIKKIAQAGLSDKVFITGFVRGEKLRQLYKMADLFVMPSVSEPFGITPLESLINGTPVLISKQSGSSEVLSHALKVDFWDIDDMASKIISVLRYESLHKCLKDNGSKEALSLSWDKAAEKCIDIYNRI